jgi:hypothetical protein
VSYRRSADRTRRVPVMVCNAWNHWVSTLCASSRNVNNLKTRRFGYWICLRLQVMRVRHLLCWVPYKDWISALDRNRPSFLNIGLYRHLKFATMSKVHKPRNSESGATNKLHGPSPRANYTDRATAACRRSDCQLLRIKGATWSA